MPRGGRESDQCNMGQHTQTSLPNSWPASILKEQQALNGQNVHPTLRCIIEPPDEILSQVEGLDLKIRL